MESMNILDIVVLIVVVSACVVAITLSLRD